MNQKNIVKSEILNRNFFFTASFQGKNETTKWKHFIWSCSIGFKGKGAKKVVTIDYKMGLGHVDTNGRPKPPKLDDVLFSLIRDAQSSECSLNEFAREFCEGMEVEEVLKTYNDCKWSSHYCSMLELSKDDFAKFDNY